MPTDQNQDQQPAPQQSPRGFQPVYISIEDFTKLGLLTQDEIREGKNMCREIAVEASQPLAKEIAKSTHIKDVIKVESNAAPRTSSETTYEDTYSPKGLREEYNSVSAPLGADEVIGELTVEASIYNTTHTNDTFFSFLRECFGGKSNAVPVRYFSITASARLRDPELAKETTSIISINAVQDPENPDLLRVDFIQDGPKSYGGNWQAKRFAEMLDTIRAVQDKVGEKLDVVKANSTEFETKQVQLPVAAPSA